MYAKVFASLWEGSMVGQADAQLVFVFLLAHADPDGNVEKTQEVIAALTGMTVERVNAALGVLCAPDARSRTRVEEGKRLIALDPERGWGWHVVNYRQYRNYIDAESRRAADRERQQRHRDASRSVTVGHASSRQGEGEGEGEGTTPSSLRSEGCAEQLPGMVDAQDVGGAEGGRRDGGRTAGSASGSPACGRLGASAGFRSGSVAGGLLEASTAFWLPLVTGERWEPGPEQVAAWRAACPGVAMEREFAKMRAWLESNRRCGKTRRGVAAFVNRWLASAQDELTGGARARAAGGRRAGADARYIESNAESLRRGGS